MTGKQRITDTQPNELFGHTTWLHNHANFEDDFIQKSAVISKTSSEQRRIPHQDYQLPGPNYNCQDK